MTDPPRPTGPPGDLPDVGGAGGRPFQRLGGTAVALEDVAAKVATECKVRAWGGLSRHSAAPGAARTLSPWGDTEPPGHCHRRGTWSSGLWRVAGGDPGAVTAWRDQRAPGRTVGTSGLDAGPLGTSRVVLGPPGSPRDPWGPPGWTGDLWEHPGWMRGCSMWPWDTPPTPTPPRGHSVGVMLPLPPGTLCWSDAPPPRGGGGWGCPGWPLGTSWLAPGPHGDAPPARGGVGRRDGPGCPLPPFPSPLTQEGPGGGRGGALLLPFR